ncbi:DUF6804 family protein [Acinetobacter soli]|uniref:DUF6804 family protein n=1 Tax=Acinetobacter soli TaxID=487316 RepID=UPI001C089A4A|nr:DUF6804 family protein [Acinetobacter soli]
MKEKHLFYIASLLMVLAVINLPYAYYQLLRFVALFAFGMAAYISFYANQKIIPYVLGFMAILFNPFIKINLGRELWMIVDVVSGVGLAIWTFTFFKKN